MTGLQQYSRWVDPAPLEVERPRLPWWTMLPRKLLLVASPILVAVVLGWLVMATARKLWRYPVTVSCAAVAAGLVAGYPWWVPVAVFGGIGAGLGGWAWAHRESFDRTVLSQLRSEWRRGAVYALGWKRTMVFCDLTKRAGHTRYYPYLRRVRAEAWRDRVSVRLLRGQCPAAYAARAEELAHSFGARSCRVRVDRPRRVWLDFVHTDPLIRPIPLPPLPAQGAGRVDLRRVVIGRTETGRGWVLRVQSRHVLVAGVTDAGKSSVAWSLLWALAPAIRCGAVQVFGIDPKGGMELGRAPHVFHRLIFGNGLEAVELLEHVATVTRQRAEQLRRSHRRAWAPGCGQPFVILLVDELADVVAYQPDNALRKRANLALQSIISQGRAPGVAVIGLVQDPRKSVVDFRHLFPVRIALRLEEAEQVDMVLGDGVRERGATAHEIDEATPGVAWTKLDGRREPTRARAFHPTDNRPRRADRLPHHRPIRCSSQADQDGGGMTTTVVDLLDAIRTHLDAFEAPGLCSLHLSSHTPRINAQLRGRDAPTLAADLLAWADTLTEPTAGAWRVPDGDSVHLSVTGFLPGGALVRVYGAMPFTEHGLGAELKPDDKTPVPLATLRHLPTLGEVTA